MRTAALSFLFIGFCATTQASCLNELRHNIFYMGFNTGTSFATAQTFDHYSEINGNHHSDREEYSARGYNGGAFLGYNFTACDKVILALEIGGDLYSNRGYGSTQFFYPTPVPASSNFEFSADVDYSLRLSLRPAYIINDCNLLYLEGGISYAEVNMRATNLVSDFVTPENDIVNDREGTWGLTLGVGLQHRITPCFSVFTAYEYTRYRRLCFRDIVQFNPEGDIGTLGGRDGIVDTNIFKLGFMFTL